MDHSHVILMCQLLSFRSQIKLFQVIVFDKGEPIQGSMLFLCLAVPHAQIAGEKQFVKTRMDALFQLINLWPLI